MDSSASRDGLFSLLPESRPPWSKFLFSTTTQALLVAFLLWLRLLHPEIIAAPEHTFRSVQLVPTPVPVNHQPQPVRILPKPQLVAELDPPPHALRLPAPQPKPRVETDETAPTVSIASKKMNTLPVTSAPVIPKVIKTNVFSTGSSAAPTVALAPSQVQTGGFGDPNGVPAKDGHGKPINIAQLGSFDLPSGPGYGNGTGGAKGVRGIVPSSGFGNGVAIPVESKPVARAQVQQGGFGDADVPAPPTVHSRPAEASTAKTLPAEILSKPTPIYTAEARSLKIQGEVLVEVVLEATGKLRVLRVVRGLGHGLDDEAVREAGEIHFKPATRDGQPVDSTVILHVIFQLA